MATLLNIRLIQIKRELNNAGAGVLLILGLIWLLIYVSFTTYQKIPEAYYLTVFLTIICLGLQSYRKDKQFVYQHIDKPHFEIYSEYVMLTLPFSISSLLTSNWICFFLLLATLFIVPFNKYIPKQKTYFKNLSSIILPSNFEWLSGFRKSFYYLIPLYVLALCFSWFRIVPLCLLWCITVAITSFYNECEPIQILRESGLSTKGFLKNKLFQHSKYLIILYVPILIINTIFNIDYWEVNLLFIPIQISLICFAICLKYSSYIPNQNSIANNVTLSLVALGSIIPYLLPIPLIMTFEYYHKAKNNLEQYLND